MKTNNKNLKDRKSFFLKKKSKNQSSIKQGHFPLHMLGKWNINMASRAYRL